MFFLVSDFPASIILVVSGIYFGAVYGVVGVPEFLDDYFGGHWLLVDVIWPALVFQIIGTINWTMLIYLLRIALHSRRNDGNEITIDSK